MCPFPAVNNIYDAHKESVIKPREEKSLDLVGDGSCDSPGHSAKCGTYTLMNIKSGKVSDFNATHVAQAGNSAKVELAGLKSLLTSLESRNVNVSSLTTDRNLPVIVGPPALPSPLPYKV